MLETAPNYNPLIPKIESEQHHDDYIKVVDSLMEGSLLPDQTDHPLYALLTAVTERIVEWDKDHPIPGLDVPE
jgi:hypothetical protein